MNTSPNITSEKSHKPTSSNQSELDRKAPTELSPDQRACTKAKSAKAKSKNRNRKQPLFTELTPISAGMTRVYVLDHTQVPRLLNTMTQEALKKSKFFDFPMPDVTCVLSLHAGPTHHIAHAQDLDEANRATETGIAHKHQTIEAPDGFDWMSVEGSAVLCQIIKKAKGWVLTPTEN